MRSQHDQYLRPTFFIDCDDPSILAFVDGVIDRAATPTEKAGRLFIAVRDRIRYDPYAVDLSPEGFKASATLARGRGFCIPKAVLLTASCRAVGVPARLGFADVINHLSTPRLRSLMESEVFVYHGFSEILIDGRWLKATCAFNASLCERFGVSPLEFDGKSDALLQEMNDSRHRFMEYVRDRGSHPDLPYGDVIRTMREAYPKLFEQETVGDFEEDAGE